MIYRDALSAVIRCLAEDCIDTASKQAWQRLSRDASPGPRPGPRSTAQERLALDCLVHARLHRELPPRLWHVLVARYSTHNARKVEAIGRLVPQLRSPAPQLFRYKAVTTWAIPQQKGRSGRRSTDMLVLPAEFYDMNTWDPEGRPEQTRRRWRAGIRKELEAMVDAALVQVQAILQDEGLLIDEAT
ncbi:hypothetical protein GCM10027398_16230 [Azotobacter salinestris]